MGLILKQETSVQAGFLFGGILKGFSHNEIPLVAAETADIVGSPWAADEVVGWSVCCPWAGPFHLLSTVLCIPPPPRLLWIALKLKFP